MRAIGDHGPISFAEYMELALYGPGGYYERTPVGAGGDFVTSPHVHPIFATLLADAIRELRRALGDPEPLRIAEVGAGDGTLARQLIDRLRDIDLVYTALERSSGARDALATLDGVRLAESLQEDAHVILANELLDNLPFRRIRMSDDGPLEVRVGLDDDGRLHEVLVDAGGGADADALAAAEGLLSGEETVISEGADAFVGEVAAALRRGHGYALLIDYGAVGAPGGEAHGYRAHREVDIPLDEPGTTDITSGVDFAWVSRHAQEHGLIAFPSMTQFESLKALGFEEWVSTELQRQHTLLEARDAEAVRAWSARSRATLLVDPAAFGRFRWLLLATPGLPAPGWLR